MAAPEIVRGFVFGTYYRVIARPVLELGEEPLIVIETLDAEGKQWALSVAEFEGGRFEQGHQVFLDWCTEQRNKNGDKAEQDRLRRERIDAARAQEEKAAEPQ